MQNLKSKYGNQKVERDGYWFSSKLEAAVYELIKLRERAGELKFLQCQDTVYLSEAKVIYKPDFKVQDALSGDIFWIEAKGFKTQRWTLITKLWAAYGPGKLEIWEGKHGSPMLTKTIIPKERIDGRL